MAFLVALLRAVNVGGRNAVPMPKLRTMFAELGHPDARTYLQSGNVVFGSSRTERTKLAGDIEDAIAATFGLDIRVLLRTHRELAAVAADTPFPDPDADTAKLHVLFLEETPPADLVAGLDADRSPPDEFVVKGSEVYLRYPNGSGRSKLTASYFERSLSMAATARNWNTVTRLVTISAPAG